MQFERKEVIGNCTLFLADCLTVMPNLQGVDAVVTDPPYGINENHKKNASRGKKAKPRDYGTFEWDSQPASLDHIKAIRAVSQHQIIFGGNYFEGLGPTPCWLVWDKENGSNDFADCELAWTNLDKAVRRIYWRWNGMIRKGNDVREHPTQKPEGVMAWCLEQLPKTTKTVLDPFMGSGTTLVACAKAGMSGIGIERDPAYFDIACRRVHAAYDQKDLFAVNDDAPVMKQASFLDGGAA